MSEQPRLAQCYRAHLLPALRARLASGANAELDVETRLRAALAAGRARWPEIALDGEDLVAYLAERIAEDECPRAALDERCLEDLYLACACVRGDQAALRAFERGPLTEVAAALRRGSPSGTIVDDARQQVAALLLTSADGDSPRIGQYAGRGSLRAWVRVIAVRAAHRLREREAREQPSDDDSLFDAAATAGEPELDYLKGAYRALFKQAFHSALADLSAHDRLLLRQHFVDGLSIDQLGALHSVHRATAARWLARLRERLLERTRRRMRAALKVDQAELDSVMRLIASRLEVSLRSALSAISA